MLNFFDIDSLFHECINNHYKKFAIYLVKNDFQLIFDNEQHWFHIKSELPSNLRKFCLKRFLILGIE